MYFEPNNNNTEFIAKKRGITDTLVLLVTILLFVISATFPFWKVIAETKVSDNQLVISITNKDYSTLLSYLFERVDREVPENASEYMRDIDEYRVRIAHSIKENDKLVSALYALTESFPKKLKEGYREEIDGIRMEEERLKIAILPYIENDISVSTAVIEKYELYPSFTEWLISRINGASVTDNLNSIQQRSYNLRKEIALLYIKINSVTKGDSER